MSETTINTTHRTLTLVVPDYVRDAESFAAWTQDEANKAIAALGRAVLRHSTDTPTARPAEPAGTLEEKAVLLIASEIGDAIVAHDAGERVNAIVRARHVLAALPAPVPTATTRTDAPHSVGFAEASGTFAAPPVVSGQGEGRVSRREEVEKAIKHYAKSVAALARVKPDLTLTAVTLAPEMQEVLTALLSLLDAVPSPEAGSGEAADSLADGELSVDYWQMDQAVNDAIAINRPDAQILRLIAIRDSFATPSRRED